MKTIKALASVTVLTMAAVGAYAVPVSVSNFADVIVLEGATTTGTGAGDLSGGVLTYDLIVLTDLGVLGTASVTSTGTWTDGDPGTNTGSILSCTGLAFACDQVQLGPWTPEFSSGPLSLSEVAPTIFTVPPGPGGLLGETTWTVTPVPLPAAAWLFGSAVLGLVGVGRRRQAKA